MDEVHQTQVRSKQWDQLIASAKTQAELLMVTSPTCEVCHQLITTRGRRARRHWSCEPDSIVGQPCTCLSGCSDSYVGNGSVDCNPSCKPCQINHGKRIRS